MNNHAKGDLVGTITRELSSGEPPWSSKSLKDVLVSINRQVLALEQRFRYAPEVSKAARGSAVVALGALCLFITLAVAFRREDDNFVARYAVELMALGLMGGALALLLFVEAIPVVQTLLKSLLCRIGIGFFFAMAVVTSTGSASTALNAALGVDASNAPIARALLTGVLVMKAGWWIAAVVGGVGIIQALLLATKLFKGEGVEQLSGENVFVIVCTVLLGWAYSAVLFRGFDDAALPSKAYMLAQRYDFNDRALCLESRLPPEQYSQFKYLFVGAQQQEVLIVARLRTSTLNASFFLRPDGDAAFAQAKAVLATCTGSLALPALASATLSQ
jgi:hypothetical protein